MLQNFLYSCRFSFFQVVRPIVNSPYRFDFGDDWMHRLRLEKIYPLEAAAIGDEPYTVIVKKVGESPAQYEDDEEDET